MLKNKLKALRAKESEITLGEGENTVTIKVSGLAFPELSDLFTIAKEKSNKDAAEFLLFTTLRKATPIEGEDGFTDSELKELIANLNAVDASKIVSTVQELSGIGGDEDKFRKEKA